jgi:hypothetical protein
MGWILWGAPADPLPPKSRGTDSHKSHPSLATENSGTPPDPLDYDVYNEPGDDGDCELEWDSWIRDLARQARAGANKSFAATVTEHLSAHLSHGPDRPVGRAASSSPVPTAPSCGQIPLTSPSPLSRHHHTPVDMLSGLNMDLLSIDSPALLTAPSVMPFQSTGVTTSTVSAGGVVRTRSLMSNDRGRGRGVARAIEVLNEGSSSGSRYTGLGRHRAAEKQKRIREEHSPHPLSAVPPTGTVTSTVTVREAGAPPTTQPYVSHLADVPPGLAVAGHTALETTSMTTSATTSTTTTTTIQLLPPRHLSSPEGVVPSSAGGKKADKARKGKRSKRPSSRGKAFSSERLVNKLDSALDFVTG